VANRLKPATAIADRGARRRGATDRMVERDESVPRVIGEK